MQTPIHRRRWKCQIQFVITIRNVATEVYEKVMASKKRVEAKAMPKTTEAPPTPESVKKVKGLLERMKKEKKEPVFKDPPAKPLAQLQSRPSADNPAKATETTADYTAKSASLLINHQNQTRSSKSTSTSEAADANSTRSTFSYTSSIPDPPTRLALSPSETAGPIPAPPQPATSSASRPAPPPYPPPNQQFKFPKPPAPPKGSDADRSDTTDTRPPLPRTRPVAQMDDDSEFMLNDNADVDTYIKVLNSISKSVPDPREKNVLAEDRYGIDYVYDIGCVPTPEEHFLRQNKRGSETHDIYSRY